MAVREVSTDARFDWLLLTPEYAPAPGGVADYSAQLAKGLVTRGDRVQVWAPAPAQTSPGEPSVHALPRGFDRLGRRRVAAHVAELDRPVILLQYVPLTFGMFPAPFVRWLCARPEPVWIMFHEVAYPIIPGQPLKHRVLAALTRRTARRLLRRADRILVSTTSWQPLIQELLGRPASSDWLPVPANVVCSAGSNPGEARAAYGIAPDARVAAHFGTYRGQLGELVKESVLELLRLDASVTCLLLGRGSREFAAALVSGRGADPQRLRGIGELAPEPLAALLSAAGVIFYPFHEGVTTRRSSLLAALSCGKAAVATRGWLTEPLWEESGCVDLCPTDPREIAYHVRALLDDVDRRGVLERRAREVYEARFALRHTVSGLRALRAVETRNAAGVRG